jgi:FixJ family two-component response regulator
MLRLGDDYRNQLYFNDPYNEHILELKDKLRIEYWRLIEQVCTQRQKDVLKLIAQGLTQSDVAHKLNMQQASVSKSLLGNTTYENKKGTWYGGSFLKLRAAMVKDPVIQAIIAEIQDIESERWG